MKLKSFVNRIHDESQTTLEIQVPDYESMIFSACKIKESYMKKQEFLDVLKIKRFYFLHTENVLVIETYPIKEKGGLPC